MRNWKTTSTGITMVVAGVAGIFFAVKNHQLSAEAITGGVGSILGGIGLISAKDYNVTGGTKPNVPNDASVVKETTKTDK
jgi:hypothetical protein